MTEAQIAHNARNAAAKADRQQRKVEAYLTHVARNNQKAEDAASMRATRREMNAEIQAFHNDALAGQAVKAKKPASPSTMRPTVSLHENALDARAAKKAAAAREAAGEPSLGTLIQLHGTEGAADVLLARAA